MHVMSDDTKIYYNGMILRKDRKERLDYILSDILLSDGVSSE